MKCRSVTGFSCNGRRWKSIPRTSGNPPTSRNGASWSATALRRRPTSSTSPRSYAASERDKTMSQRILTTHTGSLPRTTKVVEQLLAEEKNPGRHRAQLQAAVREAVAGVVRKQIEGGLDIINDGEQGRTDYTVHVMRRLTGYEGPSAPPMGTGDEEFPELAAQLKQFASPFQRRPACNGPVGWKDFASAQADIDLAKAATTGVKAEEFFMTSPSPGQIARYLKNNFYKTDEEYIF